MTIFYAFFTGTTTAQSILREDEEGTLPRLFTTPTTQSTILGGKFLSVGLTVVVQMVVLLLLGELIFHIAWGSLVPVSLITIGTIMAAATFGIFVNSFLKDTSQSGLVFGGVLTVTGMLGMLPILSGAASTSGVLATISLAVPQGWSVRGLIQAMNGAPLNTILLTLAVQVMMSIVFFMVGLLRFRKRYA
jgi:ABC-2 type transport system permease protein